MKQEMNENIFQNRFETKLNLRKAKIRESISKLQNSKI